MTFATLLSRAEASDIPKDELLILKEAIITYLRIRILKRLIEHADGEDANTLCEAAAHASFRMELLLFSMEMKTLHALRDISRSL